MRRESANRPHLAGPCQLMTVAQAAAALGLTQWAVRTAIWDGALPAVHIGRAVRVKLEDLKAWSERCAGGESAP
jgi:excisionase family DNA binding protein